MPIIKPLTSGENEAVRDERAFSNGPQDLSSHHADQLWYGTGIHMPAQTNGPRKRRHRHKHKREKNGITKQDTIPVEDERKAMGPGARVQFLLAAEDGEGLADGESLHSDAHPLFTEMEEFNGLEWRETARWVKFEEDVEEGGNRWSKPHVATLSLHSLFELRSCLTLGSVILDMEAEDLDQIVDMMLEKMVAAHQLQFHLKDEVRDALLRRHTHLYEKMKHQGNMNRNESSLTPGDQGNGGFLGKVRSLADIGKTFSHGKNMQSQVSGPELEVPGGGSKKVSTPAMSPCGPSPQTQTQLSLPKHGSVPRDIGRVSSSSNVDSSKKSLGPKFGLNRNRTVTSFFGNDSGTSKADFAPKGNLHFMKKLPVGAEASNVLIGEVEFLQQHISAFIRLKTATLLGDLTEVPVPTRFLFILLGPVGHGPQYKEIGRAIATLMSDEIFHDVAYKARNREDLLDGVDEFLDQVTVLPPGEWDPNIRIEPPSHLPSQEKRKHTEASKDGKAASAKAAGDGGENGEGDKEKEEEEGHGDPALKRTGRLFGGLIGDLKRRLPHYKSDYTDALSMQCVASVCFMFFALLAPIVTFGGLLEEATGKRMAAMENLLSAAICGIAYHLFSGQPLTIIGSTGPVLVFETILFDLCKSFGWVYLSFRLWVNIWTAIILLIMVATDASSLVSYITRFTEESFATLIALIFIVKAIEKVFKIISKAHVIDWISPYDPAIHDPNATCVCHGQEDHYGIPWFKKGKDKYHWNKTQVPWLNSVNDTFYKVDYSLVPIDECHYAQGHVEGEACYFMYDVFLMSLCLMMGTFTLAMFFKGLRNSYFFPVRIRQMFSDFAVILAIGAMCGVDLWMGLETPKLNVPSSFRPTWSGRGWVVSPFSGVDIKTHKPATNAWYTAVAALAPSILLCILIFMDQQITAVIVNRKENKLKKGSGYHLDLFVLAILIFIVGVLGLPIYVAATVLSINHVNSLRMESEARAPGERPVAIGCREQRVTGIVTFFLVGVSVMMTGVLSYIPMPVLYGVFLYMGIASLNGIQLFDRIMLIFMPMKYQPDVIYLRHVPIRRVHLFTLFQVGCLAGLWIIKSFKSTSITFPLLLVVMVGVRKLMEFVFSDKELMCLDDRMPEIHLRKKDDAKRKKEKEKEIRKNQLAAGAEREEEDEDEDDDGGISMKPVKTEAHLHIPMASGNVMTIPLTSIREEKEVEKPINISDEMNKSGVWKHISSESSLSKHDTPKIQADRPKESTHAVRRSSPPKFSTGHDDDDDDEVPITIKVEKPSPSGSQQNVNKSEERQPLLSSVKVNTDAGTDKQNESPV